MRGLILIIWLALPLAAVANASRQEHENLRAFLDQTLPRVGAVTAEHIIAARPYNAIEELREVQGVTNAIFSKTQDRVSLLDSPSLRVRVKLPQLLHCGKLLVELLL